jgi:hypothetical protein
MYLFDTISHVGHDSHRRSTSVAEDVFAEMWEKKNERKGGINFGLGYLELLLNDPPSSMGIVEDRKKPRPWRDISQRDAMVAATVIQWLGTNCGGAFLDECEREIEKRKKEARNDMLGLQEAANEDSE